ncbi:glycosyltransferase involved in cell wall biosynthesis [Microbacteriaceae bacterium SG_E_30_P1]|uniref:Glycosyltransferase involved in cell wall biosynthesis n=1 Tax=Antiquaquibacter oligotrophicus TaxID=2880260 RepID=A0ABT6KPW3_9MICO|nr:glycosyltransferase [Antiquaquibacter oligotrophicus]MDH6181841.1 glycosyltransferase involved in cell wall biosynthesis [Antiquaquibacter oligotrophicus]UDF12482.1 glycosyltransferase [Antiquaquibacter oligotrophicus]
MSTNRRLIIVNRADPVICGHSVEGRNLAEVALTRGFDDVRIVTWPLERLQSSGLPLKPLDSVLPYSEGITVERPEPVGDYKVPDGRYTAGITGRLVELLTDGVPTTVLSLYLSPHTLAVDDAVRVAQSTGLPVDVTTIAEAVGSDITNVVRSSLERDAFGAAAQIFSAYLAQDRPVAVSEYTRDIIVAGAEELDARHGTRFAEACRERIEISYPAIDTSAYLDLDPEETARVLESRGLARNRYVLFLSRLQAAKGVDDLIGGFERAALPADVELIIAGRGPDADRLHTIAAASPLSERIRFLDDVGDAEKPHLMEACAVYALPSKPSADFVETFGIAIAEKMLAGGGPVITTLTGGIGEAVGDHAIIVPVEDPDAIAAALEEALALDTDELSVRAAAARDYALQFDRENVFDKLFRTEVVVR